MLGEKKSLLDITEEEKSLASSLNELVLDCGVQTGFIAFGLIIAP